MSELVSLTIDGTPVQVPAGTLVIRAAESIGVAVPRFCDHPLLAPVGACRQCLVDVEGLRKPMASCTIPVTEGMEVRTQFSSPIAKKAQAGVMELLLINHPLDCPVCDKGGECPLQNQAMSGGRAESRFDGAKRRYPKPIPLSTEVLLDRERCVLCARCTRFADQIAGDPLIELLDRGAQQQVGIADNKPFDSYFSGNTVQICPVGALTGAAYRFRARPFDLVSSPSVCEHCASGCAQRTDHRRGKVLRRLAGDDPEVNEEWNCDKGRWAFAYAPPAERISSPLLRNESGELESVSWPQALAAAAAGLSAAGRRTGVLVGGRSTLEDSYTYGKFARVALGTNDIDFRSRDCSEEETEFLRARVAGRPIDVTYRDLERAPIVVLVAFEPDEESPIVFLRLRKASRAAAHTIVSVAPFATDGLRKMSGQLVQAGPGSEAAAVRGLAEDETIGGLLMQAGSVILVGERAASSPGLLSAVAQLADVTGARLAWVPRRAGERGALDAGALGALLPGGRPVADAAARAEVSAAWGCELPDAPGRDTAAILDAAATGEIGALVVGGVDIDDLPDSRQARRALKSADFVVSFDQRLGQVAEFADVIFPVSTVAEKSGTYLNWEGRHRSFDVALAGAGTMTDGRILDALAHALNRDIDLADSSAARAELAALGRWSGQRPSNEQVAPSDELAAPGIGEARLATWRMLLDSGRLQDGEPHLAGTARRPVVRLSANTAAEIVAGDGDAVAVETDAGSITLPLVITDLPDRVVWLPMFSPGSAVHSTLSATAGDVVRIHYVPDTEADRRS